MLFVSRLCYYMSELAWVCYIKCYYHRTFVKCQLKTFPYAEIFFSLSTSDVSWISSCQEFVSGLY